MALQASERHSTPGQRTVWHSRPASGMALQASERHVNGQHPVPADLRWTARRFNGQGPVPATLPRHACLQMGLPTRQHDQLRISKVDLKCLYARSRRLPLEQHCQQQDRPKPDELAEPQAASAVPPMLPPATQQLSTALLGHSRPPSSAAPQLRTRQPENKCLSITDWLRGSPSTSWDATT